MMKLSTGKVAFPIEFDNGDKETIYFNPNDPDLATRLIASKDKISDRLSKLNFNELPLNNDGESVDVTSINVSELTQEQIEQLSDIANNAAKSITETKKVICEELDAAFNSEVSAVVFKHCSPFAVVNGEYFIMQFLNAITPEIQKHVKKTNAEVEANMSKHINKYIKK